MRRRWSALSLFTMLSVGLGALDARAVPPCRLDNRLANMVEETATLVLQHYTFDIDGAPEFKSVVVNQESTRDDQLAIEVVFDAYEDQVDSDLCLIASPDVWVHVRRPDELSVSNVCKTVASNTIRCSAQALAALTDRDRRDRVPSAALFLILAHEVTHLEYRDYASYISPPAVIGMGWSRQEKLERFREFVCDFGFDQVVFDKESEADARAVQAFSRALQASPFIPPPPSNQASFPGVLAYAERISRAAEDYQRAHGAWLADFDLGYDRVSHVGSSQAPPKWFLCKLLPEVPGLAVVSDFHVRGHPAAIERMERIFSNLATLERARQHDFLGADIVQLDGRIQSEISRMKTAMAERQAAAHVLCELVELELEQSGSARCDEFVEGPTIDKLSFRLDQLSPQEAARVQACQQSCGVAYEACVGGREPLANSVGVHLCRSREESCSGACLVSR